MTHTDQQLKLALAKMLPGEPDNNALYWKDQVVAKSTELLHLCWMVEQNLSDGLITDYGCELAVLTKAIRSEDACWGRLAIASWQQRTLALAKVKGVEIV